MTTLTMTMRPVETARLADHVTTREDFFLQKLEAKPEWFKNHGQRTDFIISLIAALQNGVASENKEGETCLSLAVASDKLLFDTQCNIDYELNDGTEWDRNCDQWHNLAEMVTGSTRYLAPVLGVIEKSEWLKDKRHEDLPGGLVRLIQLIEKAQEEQPARAKAA